MVDTFDWRGRLWFLPAAVAVVLMRLRFLFTPVTSDEGAFLTIARAWRQGAVLYRDVWADRPQGQFVIVRLADILGLGNRVGLRLVAMAACLVGAAACGRIAARLVGQRAAVITALVVGVLASVPRYEAFLANGELFSCSIGAVSLAVALRAVWGRSRPSLALLALAGALGGCAVMVKQTGFDALGAGLFVVILAMRSQAWTRLDRRCGVPALVGGAVLPVGLAVIHAALTGWERWWYAVVTYRTGNRSLLGDADWKRFLITGGTVAPVLLPAVAIIVVVLVRRLYLRNRQLSAALAVWAFLALAAFVSGGQFFRHYWMILVFPLGTIVGVIAASIDRVGIRRGVVALALASPLGFTIQSLTVARADAGMVFSQDQWAKSAEVVADWFDERKQPGDRIYAFCAAGALYGNISEPTPFPYLWIADIRDVPDARNLLVGMLTSKDGPRYVAVFQTPEECDPSGKVAAALDAGYHRVDERAGRVILERNEP